MESSTVSIFSSPPQAAPADALSLGLLSAHLERLLYPAFLDRADAEIVLAAGGGAVVGAYSCFLAARSSFFHQRISSLPAGEKPRLELAELFPGGRHIGREALVAVLGYMYTGRFKVPPQGCVCVDEECGHGACRPAIDFVVESTYAAFGFQITELVSICQRRLSDFLNMAFDEDIIPIMHVASKCQLSNLFDQCIRKVANSTLDNKYLERVLPGDVYCNLKELRQYLFLDELENLIRGPEHDNMVRRIHKALDSNAVDIVGRLLKESAVTLDHAFAIHYAAAFCEPKVLAELLKLDSANVNLRNKGGYTPLHMACIRLDPAIILSLVEKGASVLEWTPDRRDALTICKRLTRQKDINRELKTCQERSNAHLCIDILEQTKRTVTLDVVSAEETIFTPVRVDDFHIRLADLEIRVASAKLFFPSEAQLAMRIAEADSTEEYDVTKPKEVGLDETPTMHRRLCERLDALTKTVDLGRRYFPNCSDVLDKFLDEKSADLALLGSGTREDQLIKMHFYDLRKNMWKAFDKDKAASAVIASTTSTPSSPRLNLMKRSFCVNLSPLKFVFLSCTLLLRMAILPTRVSTRRCRTRWA
ncbi:BTB/POZ domain and ankyrin repeat-containing protein NPR3-like isoform X2 [Phragmites australis]|uniref:BTB/POZ domain and ankyrin repeat-containing protein NPR3-like isoform X2 n=1 Tax=Phragmites australis TaxID=29695 RepID=UPI002D7664E1|nr:BTB/POZ domain and ankyrin repeat-containing protein NPR3-like isoform X2 [Phragmites australis]